MRVRWLLTVPQLRWTVAAVMLLEAQAANHVQAEPLPEGCQPSNPLAIIPEDDWMEMEVIMGFRVWQLMFLALAGLITVVVLLCCFMKCRVPRTKQEIEADFKRKEITRRFRFLLDRVQIEDTSLRTAIDRVNELYTNREKMKRKKKKKVEDEEEIISQGSSYLFQDDKLTIIQRVKKVMGLIKEEDSDTETESMKDKSEKSEEAKKLSGSEEDLYVLPDVKISDTTKSRPSSEESQEPSDSPKQEDYHSKLSLLPPDSPPQDAMSLLQDSPPHSGVSLIQETPPRSKSSMGSKSWTGQKTDSQESGKNSFGRQKTDSQDSYDSQQSSGKRQSSQDSEKNRSGKDSVDGRGRRQESDSQDSDSGDTKKTDCHVVIDPETVLRGFQATPRLKRRESLDVKLGKDFGNRWNKSALSGKANAKS